jgi:hypothetical protein
MAACWWLEAFDYGLWNVLPPPDYFASHFDGIKLVNYGGCTFYAPGTWLEFFYVPQENLFRMYVSFGTAVAHYAIPATQWNCTGPNVFSLEDSTFHSIPEQLTVTPMPCDDEVGPSGSSGSGSSDVSESSGSDSSGSTSSDSSGSDSSSSGDYCTWCDYFTWHFTPTGITNWACTDCVSALEQCRTLTHVSACRWETSTFDFCGLTTKWRLSYSALANTLDLRLIVADTESVFAAYGADSPACPDSGGSINLHYGGELTHCHWPSVITLYPHSC